MVKVMEHLEHEALTDLGSHEAYGAAGESRCFCGLAPLLDMNRMEPMMTPSVQDEDGARRPLIVLPVQGLQRCSQLEALPLKPCAPLAERRPAPWLPPPAGRASLGDPGGCRQERGRRSRAAPERREAARRKLSTRHQ
ncbi:unnamed protein product [Rangifer tarandus platyrhynchus]|uniref:Uncharacterized protein n=1 Tax=Rangifer tarandus platyrhynchus TaxID=3082113 RepID=A0AC59ZWZ0_RANTA